MRRFEEYEPFVITVFFLSVIVIAMFSVHPVVVFLTFITGILFYIIRNGKKHIRSHLFFAMLFVILAIANPLVSHNGVTVLFVINNNPVTLEAFLYGINSAMMIVGVLYWFRSFTQIMTSDKLLYVFGIFSPKLSLILSMALRFIPMFRNQAERVKDAQKAMGLYSDDNIIDDIRSNMRVFSIVVTWALENGITTADSMSARGYGTGKRTNFSDYRFGRSDIILLITDILLFIIVIYVSALGHLDFNFYPSISYSGRDTIGLIGSIAYGILLMLPVYIEIRGNIRWKYLMSKV